MNAPRSTNTATVDSESNVRTVNADRRVHKGLVIPARIGRPPRDVVWSGDVFELVASREVGGHDHAIVWGEPPEAVPVGGPPIAAWVSTQDSRGAENTRLRRLFGIPRRIDVRGNALLTNVDADGRPVGLTEKQVGALREFLAGLS